MQGSLTSINATGGQLGSGVPVLGYDPIFQGIIGDIVVTESTKDLVVLPTFTPVRPPMLDDTLEVDLSDPEEYAFNKFDLLMSSQPDVILEPAQQCFLNGKLFNQSQVIYAFPPLSLPSPPPCLICRSFILKHLIIP